jgi:hypothetical protein
VQKRKEQSLKERSFLLGKQLFQINLQMLAIMGIFAMIRLLV